MRFWNRMIVFALLAIVALGSAYGEPAKTEEIRQSKIILGEELKQRKAMWDRVLRATNGRQFESLYAKYEQLYGDKSLKSIIEELEKLNSEGPPGCTIAGCPSPEEQLKERLKTMERLAAGKGEGRDRDHDRAMERDRANRDRENERIERTAPTEKIKGAAKEENEAWHDLCKYSKDSCY